MSDEEYKKFLPENYGLDKNFKLTDFTGLKGWGCKVPQKVLLKLLEGLESDDSDSKQQSTDMSPVIGMCLKYDHIIISQKSSVNFSSFIS